MYKTIPTSLCTCFGKMFLVLCTKLACAALVVSSRPRPGAARGSSRAPPSPSLLLRGGTQSTCPQSTGVRRDAILTCDSLKQRRDARVVSRVSAKGESAAASAV